MDPSTDTTTDSLAEWTRHYENVAQQRRVHGASPRRRPASSRRRRRRLRLGLALVGLGIAVALVTLALTGP